MMRLYSFAPQTSLRSHGNLEAGVLTPACRLWTELLCQRSGIDDRVILILILTYIFALRVGKYII